jgi:hypothetical protein
MPSNVIRLIALLLAALFMASGCAVKTQMDSVKVYLTLAKPDEEELKRIKDVVVSINDKNDTVENSAEWFKEAYSSLNIKKLNDIPRADYEKYRDFINEKGSVFVIVHPAFYTFFENDAVLSSKGDAKSFPSKNIAERLYDMPSFFDYKFKVMQEQERILRDFLEIMSTGKKLVILLIPRNYKSHLTYGHIEGLDEYSRYINEITNSSESVIYMESSGYSTGKMRDEDLKIFADFLKELQVERILLGGGYIGRCLQDFYISLLDYFDSGNIYIVPEIAAVSPQDINDKWGKYLLKENGELDMKVAAKNLKTPNAYEKQTITPRIRRLYMYKLEKH